MSERCKHGIHAENPCFQCDEDRSEKESSLALATGSAPISGPYAFITSKDMLRAADICAKAAHDPLNRGEIACILLGASRILENTSLRPSVPNAEMRHANPKTTE